MLTDTPTYLPPLPLPHRLDGVGPVVAAFPVQQRTEANPVNAWIVVAYRADCPFPGKPYSTHRVSRRRTYIDDRDAMILHLTAGHGLDFDADFDVDPDDEPLDPFYEHRSQHKSGTDHHHHRYDTSAENGHYDLTLTEALEDMHDRAGF